MRYLVNDSSSSNGMEIWHSPRQKLANSNEPELFTITEEETLEWMKWCPQGTHSKPTVESGLSSSLPRLIKQTAWLIHRTCGYKIFAKTTWSFERSKSGIAVHFVIRTQHWFSRRISWRPSSNETIQQHQQSSSVTAPMKRREPRAWIQTQVYPALQTHLSMIVILILTAGQHSQHTLQPCSSPTGSSTTSRLKASTSAENTRSAHCRTEFFSYQPTKLKGSPTFQEQISYL